MSEFWKYFLISLLVISVRKFIKENDNFPKVIEDENELTQQIAQMEQILNQFSTIAKIRREKLLKMKVQVQELNDLQQLKFIRHHEAALKRAHKLQQLQSSERNFLKLFKVKK